MRIVTTNAPDWRDLPDEITDPQQEEVPAGPDPADASDSTKRYVESLAYLPPYARVREIENRIGMMQNYNRMGALLVPKKDYVLRDGKLVRRQHNPTADEMYLWSVVDDLNKQTETQRKIPAEQRGVTVGRKQGGGVTVGRHRKITVPVSRPTPTTSPEPASKTVRRGALLRSAPRQIRRPSSIERAREADLLNRRSRFRKWPPG